MSGYFDHVRCHNCNAQIDPERIEKVRGKMACPACGEDLGLSDLFGVKASFLDDDSPNVSLDDLVPGGDGHFDNPWGAPAASAESQGSYKWATQEEIDAHQANLRGAPVERGASRAAPPVRSVGINQGAAPSRPAPGRGVADHDLPAGAVRARHIDPPDDFEDAHTETPEPPRRRRFRGPEDVAAEENALVHQPSSRDEFEEEAEQDDSALEALRKLKEERKKKRRRF